MDSFRQRLTRRISISEWQSSAHPDVSQLPWRGDDGRQICSIVMLPGGGSDPLVVMLDAFGTEVRRTTDGPAILATLKALKVMPRMRISLPATNRLAAWFKA